MPLAWSSRGRGLRATPTCTRDVVECTQRDHVREVLRPPGAVAVALGPPRLVPRLPLRFVLPARPGEGRPRPPAEHGPGPEGREHRRARWATFPFSRRRALGEGRS